MPSKSCVSGVASFRTDSSRHCATTSVMNRYSDTGTSFFSMRCTRMTSTPASSTLRFTFCSATSPSWATNLIDRLSRCSQLLQSQGWSFLICSRRVRNLWRICGGRSHTRTLVLPPGAQKNAASPSSFANFMPLAASMTDSSNCATVHCAWARCLRFQCM
ncbi:Uncharacterised protein [Mycobacterium tuberculosis]|nr:Uncharacterised protein [Mycobacterium tuberculosis]